MEERRETALRAVPPTLLEKLDMAGSFANALSQIGGFYQS
jgi:hypothetical protein